ncbi:MAG TPA: hypothetical protein VHE34_29050 [Puia sp.]|uniref:hypothetical protein n=1 Tax=Puia sp. TaxID=2045100 RepID=UPI002CEC3003|nr:hypothetical protein [Puia sp.]HVU99318.1 hypothetical protein [Puia sp.]
MAKSSLLLLCCTLFACSVWAQKSLSDPFIPQKLTLKRADLGWTAGSSYLTFAKKTWDAGDDSRSILYTGPQKKEAFDLRLPEMRNKKVDFEIKAGRQEPLFRRQ